MPVTTEIIEHCNKYKMCIGCPFNGGKCVAPVGDHLYAEWLKTMNDLINESKTK